MFGEMFGEIDVPNQLEIFHSSCLSNSLKCSLLRIEMLIRA